MPCSVELVMPAKVTSTTEPAATVRPVNSEHWTVLLNGLEQLPTSTPAVTSRTVPPAQPRKPVSGGKSASMRLLAWADIAPVAESVKRAT